MFFHRRRQGHNQEEALRLLAKQLHDLGLRVAALEERLDALESAHKALRGRFYATRGEGSAPPQEDKAAILRRMGYVPGKPFNHT